MSNVVQEVYNYLPLAANYSNVVSAAPATIFGGFICTAAGNFTLQDANGNTIIAPMAVAVGQTVYGGFFCPLGLKVVLSVGAAGTLLWTE